MSRAFGQYCSISLSVGGSPGNRRVYALDVLMCFEMELGREALTTLRADDRAERVNKSSKWGVQCSNGRGRRTESSSERS